MDSLKHYGVLGMKWGHRKSRNNERKSAHRIRLEAKYLSKNMSRRDAELMAEKRIRGEKIALGLLGLAIGVGIAYKVNHEVGKRYSGVLLQKGKTLHYINAHGDNNDLNRHMFTSFTKTDKLKYKGIYSETLRMKGNHTVYDTILKTKDTIKAPSHNEALKMYREFVGDKVSAKEYMRFNADLYYGVGGGKNKEFIDFVKSKGYNAILDSNDQFLSGYNAKKPLMLFNAESVVVKAGENIVKEQLSKKINLLDTSYESAKSKTPAVVLGAAAISASRSLATRKKFNEVNKYFEKNPNSKLTYGEVYNLLNKKGV